MKAQTLILSLLVVLAMTCQSNHEAIKSTPPRPLEILPGMTAADMVAAANKEAENSVYPPQIEFCRDSNRICINLHGGQACLYGRRIEDGETYQQARAAADSMLLVMEHEINKLNAELEQRVGESVNLFLMCDYHAFDHRGYWPRYFIDLDHHTKHGNQQYQFGEIWSPSLEVVLNMARRLPWENMRIEDAISQENGWPIED